MKKFTNYSVFCFKNINFWLNVLKIYFISFILGLILYNSLYQFFCASVLNIPLSILLYLIFNYLYNCLGFMFFKKDILLAFLKSLKWLGMFISHIFLYGTYLSFSLTLIWITLTAWSDIEQTKEVLQVFSQLKSDDFFNFFFINIFSWGLMGFVIKTALTLSIYGDLRFLPRLGFKFKYYDYTHVNPGNFFTGVVTIEHI